MTDALANLGLDLDVMTPCARVAVVDGLQGVRVLAAAVACNQAVRRQVERRARSHFVCRDFQSGRV